MLLVAVGLRCLDPVLTIICCLARDDPFITPASPEDRKTAITRKYEMAPDNLSDHLALLRAYHLWEKANDEGRKRQVKYFIHAPLTLLSEITQNCQTILGLPRELFVSR